MHNLKLNLEKRFNKAGASTDIYSLVSVLVRNDAGTDNSSSAQKFWPELSIEQIGRIYAATIFFEVPERIWLSRQGQFYNPSAEREAKKEFQEATRIPLYKLIHKLDKRVNPDLEEGIMAAYAASSEKIKETSKITAQGTIEHRIKLLAGIDEFYAIGSSLISGSKEYHQSKPENINHKFKVFMEYDKILRYLSR